MNDNAINCNKILLSLNECLSHETKSVSNQLKNTVIHMYAPMCCMDTYVRMYVHVCSFIVHKYGEVLGRQYLSMYPTTYVHTYLNTPVWNLYMSI